MDITWFIFDLGNTVIKLAYERVLAAICARSAVDRDELVEILEDAGGYRDLERGGVTFAEFHEFLADRAGYRGALGDLRTAWSDFFEGTLPGIEDLIARLRQKYRIAFLSNSNEVHAEVIPRKFATVFEPDDRLIFSYRFKCAKPDPEMFQRALEVIGALPRQAAFVDDLLENVLAARSLGMTAFQFHDAFQLERDFKAAGLL
ncbi:MAG TPA: HAD family phosphatase [Thermoanaerobaculia bacterium]|nr:HAD family phosphatase [Thermoanaerobaculia bacterium]